MAPTLVASRTALPPGGAELRLGRPGASFVAPTLVASCTALPPGGALRLRPGKAGSAAPTGEFGDSRRVRNHVRGFTLIELLVVVAIMAIATAGVGLSLRDNSGTVLEREAQRLAALLDSARAQSRMSAVPVRWRSTATGFAFDGLADPGLPTQWLSSDVQAVGMPVIALGPEPVIGPQQIRLISISRPDSSVTLATDGVRPFSVMTVPPAGSGSP